MINKKLAGLGVIAMLGMTACDSNRNAPNTPKDRPPIVNGDSTPPTTQNSPGSAASESGMTTGTSSGATTSGSVGGTTGTTGGTSGSADAGTMAPASTTMAMKDSAMGAAHTAGKAMDDSWITTKTKSSLLAESDLKSGDIAVETHSGAVTLKGSVPSAAQSDKATMVARGVEGVTTVDNRLTVRN